MVIGFKVSAAIVAMPLLMCVPLVVQAAEIYPDKPVRLIIPFTPGGGADTVGRLIANRLTERLGRQTVVDNRGGAGGVIGTDMVAKASPDGYTLAFVPASFTMQPALQKLPYDPVKSFEPVSRVGKGAFVLVVTPNVPATTLKAFIAHVRQNPGKLFFGTAGAGSSAHMFIELFKMMAHIDFTPVHFKGGNQQVIDLLGGHSHGTMISLPAVRPHIAAGRLRALAVTTAQRSVFLPDVPGIAEGDVPGYDASVWWGILAPSGTPASVVGRLNDSIRAVLMLDDIRQAFSKQGVEPDYHGTAAFRPFIAAEMARWKDVVTKGNIRLQ